MRRHLTEAVELANHYGATADYPGVTARILGPSDREGDQEKPTHVLQLIVDDNGWGETLELWLDAKALVELMAEAS